MSHSSYNASLVEEFSKVSFEAVRTIDSMPKDNGLEVDNPIRKKVEEKFDMKVTVGPSDYQFQYQPWAIKSDNGNASEKEICIYSEYEADRKYHLGLIDFETPDYFKAEALMAILGQHAPWLLYKSGRSFHGYIKMALLKEQGWAKFMGRLLLANEKGAEKIIDDRWVGWCLLKGWAALRITKNDPHYLQIPELVAESD